MSSFFMRIFRNPLLNIVRIAAIVARNRATTKIDDNEALTDTEKGLAKDSITVALDELVRSVEETLGGTPTSN